VLTLGIGLARGAAILAGMIISAGMDDRARESVFVALVAGWTNAALLILPLPLFERSMIGLFSSEPLTIERAERALALLRWSTFGIATWQVLLASFAAYGATMRASVLIILGDACGLATAYAWPGSRLDAACIAWIVAGSVKGLLPMALVFAGRLRVTRVAGDVPPDAAIDTLDGGR
jgi:Na+-driven multidrug efflux pump